MKFKITDWKPLRRGAFYGTAAVTFDEYLTVRLTVRDGKNGIWAAMPASKWTDRNAKDRWEQQVEFTDKEAANRFQKALITALCERFPEDFLDPARQQLG